MKKIQKSLIIFYLIGIIGFVLPFTKHIFIAITPLALIGNMLVLYFFHEPFTKKTVITYLFICIAGYIIEVIGVKTGVIFGSYAYGKTLGISLFETPLIIGINWLFVSYTSLSIAKLLFKKSITFLLLAPLIMVIYDIILEQVAPKMNMWSWENSIIPLKNYIAWYLIGLCFVVILHFQKISVKNPLSLTVFICQFLFFLMLFLLV